MTAGTTNDDTETLGDFEVLAWPTKEVTLGNTVTADPPMDVTVTPDDVGMPVATKDDKPLSFLGQPCSKDLSSLAANKVALISSTVG